MINENKIREACASNRERGFKMLMDSFQVPIYNYIRRLVVSHEDAEDVLQEVFIRVFRHIDQFREESSLSTWIYRIATNESLRLLNGRKDEGVVSAEDVQEELMRPYNFNIGCPNSIFRLKPRTSLIGNAVLQYIHSTKSFDFIIGTFLVNSVTYT